MLAIRMILFFKILFYPPGHAFNTSAKYDTSCLKPYCECDASKKEATCSHLSFIPKLPSYVEKLWLSYNTFYNLSRKMMSNISSNNMKEIAFEGNSMHHLNEDALTDFPLLTSLEISNETYLNDLDVRNAIHCCTFESLKTLKLESNHWKSIAPDIFFNSKLKELSLARNRLKEHLELTIDKIQGLKKLNLSYNTLERYDVRLLYHLEELDLSYNNLDKLLTFCCENDEPFCCENPGCTSKTPNLTVLNLAGNRLDFLLVSTLYCLPSLEVLDLSFNWFFAINDNLFASMPVLQKLLFQHNTHLRKIRPFAFNSSSIQYLSISDNIFNFDNHSDFVFDPHNIFRYLPNLECLDLSNNILTSGDILDFLFQNLTNILTLRLQGVGLSTLPFRMFRSMQSLQDLVLSENSISYWPDGTLDNMKNLRRLNVRSNKIQLLNETSIKPSILSRLDNLDLSDNPFMCTCDLLWFREWIRHLNDSKLLQNFPRDYKCSFPSDIRDILLVRFNPTLEGCTLWSPLLTLAIVLSLFGLAVFMLILTVYKCHSNIRNYLYLFRLHRLQKQGYLELEKGDNFEFHGFVVYCDPDREWVHQSLVKKMEDKGIKLCIHHRNFDAGVPITENIDKFVSKSWKIVVVMSNDFARSEWCQWETEFVHERRRRQGKDAFVLIMLRTIDSAHMTSSIKALLHTTPYLRYQPGIGEDLFWQAVTNALLKPLSVPPMAI